MPSDPTQALTYLNLIQVVRHVDALCTSQQQNISWLEPVHYLIAQHYYDFQVDRKDRHVL